MAGTAFTYVPLSQDIQEIRLLTIIPEDDISEKVARPIECLLNHYELQALLANRCNAQFPRYKGCTHSWPESYEALDAGLLNRKQLWIEQKLWPRRIDTDLAATSPPEEDDTASPWRFAWGDFVALSYVWGTDVPRHKININGHSFEVNENLYHALLKLRTCTRIKQGFMIWIDAICINQADVAERNQQVAIMHQIYSWAWQVVIWLGVPSHRSDVAMAALRWMSARMESTSADKMNSFYASAQAKRLRLGLPFKFFINIDLAGSPMWNPEVFEAIYHFLNRPYWRRLWVLQEIVMARVDAPVLCGDACLLWREIHNAMEFIVLDEPKFNFQVEHRLKRWGTLQVARDRELDSHVDSPKRTWRRIMAMTKLQQYQNQALEHTQDQRQYSREPEDYIVPLLLARDADVSLQHDRVYGVLGIRSIVAHVKVRPDYNQPLSEVYQAFSRSLLENGCMDILRLVQHPPGSVYPRWKTSWGDFFVNQEASSFVFFSRIMRLEPRELIASCNHKLPSWVVCWTCQALPVAQSFGRYHAGHGAGIPFIPPRFSLIQSMLRVTLRGMLVDELTALSTFDARDSQGCSLRSSNLRTERSSAYGDIEDTRRALLHTLTCNTTESGIPKTAPTYEPVLQPRIWFRDAEGIYMSTFSPYLFMQRNRELEICGYTFEELILGTTDDKLKRRRIAASSKAYTLNTDALQAVSCMVNVLAWRRIGATNCGRMALCAAPARLGDRVAIILGCSVPMLLRPKTDGAWTLVGEAYVHGLMEGEALAVRDGELINMSDIELY